ncbi:MAG: hypothetical protein E7540_06610 [Ruminococcaceae bacterium]|nr:hypothetical protein [Oscillospiraceae bacterium]
MRKKIILSIIYICIGSVLFGLGCAEMVDSFWSGMGGALIAVGIVNSIRVLRYYKDESYRDKKEIEIKDERNRFIRNKSWAWAGYSFVFIAAICTIAFKLLGQDLLSMAASFAVCIIITLYWICFLIIKKKY